MKLEDTFPLTQNCYIKGINRCYEPIDLDEKNAYCGPEDRPCIDCYIPLSLICIPFDILTCCMIKNKSQENKLVIDRTDSNEDDTKQDGPKLKMKISYV